MITNTRCLLIKCPFPAAQQPYKIVAIKIWPQNIPASSCWSKPSPSISGSSPDTSTFGVLLVSSFKCNHLNFQTFWSWLFLAQLPFTCLIFFKGRRMFLETVYICEAGDASKIVLPKI